MKRVLVVEKTSAATIESVNVLNVVSEHDNVTQARHFLKNEADDGTYSILTQVLADVLVKTRKETKRDLEGGQGFIHRGVNK